MSPTAALEFTDDTLLFAAIGVMTLAAALLPRLLGKYGGKALRSPYPTPPLATTITVMTAAQRFLLIAPARCAASWGIVNGLAAPSRSASARP